MLAEYRPDQIVVSPSRKTVERLESYLKQFPQHEIKAEHRFAEGVYIRQITIPAGVIATGAACKQEHLSVMVRGRMHVLADGAMQELSGFHQWIAPAGVKRVGVALEDTVWFTVHPNPKNTRDIKAIEDALYEQAEDLQHRRLADGRATLDRSADRADFTVLIAQAGFTAEQVRAQSENEADQMPMPPQFWGRIVIADSDIEGRGVFMTESVETNAFIGPGRIEGKRTPLGRFTNHSRDPNARFVMNGDDIDLRAVRHIARGEEVTVSYRQALALSGINVPEVAR